SSRSGCRCSKTILHRISVNNVAKVEVTPPSGRCRRAERVVITKKGSKVCISPNAEWFPEFLNRLDRDYEDLSMTTVSEPSTTF
ncbi:hypothetical protein GOODEAATRI_023923, partial [Goodea atripinnis]